MVSLSYHHLLTVVGLILAPKSIYGQDANVTYVGPKSCSSDPSVIGYDSLETLQDDMLYDGVQVHVNDESPNKEYVYTLCPSTTFDVDSLELGNTIAPILNHTTVKCGNDNNDCILMGGMFAVLFWPDLILQNFTMKGVKFVNSYGLSVAGWAHPRSSAFFENCTWEGHREDTIVEVMYEPSHERRRTRDLIQSSTGHSNNHFEDFKDQILKNPSLHDLASIVVQNQGLSSQKQNVRRAQGWPSMIMGFYDCAFKDNEVGTALVMTAGGILEFQSTDFHSNSVGLFAIGAIYGAHLFLHSGSTFVANQSPLFTIFVDADSFLQLNEKNMGSDNQGITCTSGIFIENQGSFCLIGGTCHGSCCEFGNSECDLYEGDIFEDEEEASKSSASEDEFTTPAVSSLQATSSSSEGGVSCGTGCIAFATIVPVLVIGLGLLGIRSYSKIQKDRSVNLGNAPTNPID